MTDILEEIFNSPVYDNYDKSPELDALIKKEIALWDQLKPVIGLNAIDEIHNVQAQIAHHIDLESFRQGIRLGAALVLELIK